MCLVFLLSLLLIFGQKPFFIFYGLFSEKFYQKIYNSYLKLYI